MSEELLDDLLVDKPSVDIKKLKSNLGFALVLQLIAAVLAVVCAIIDVESIVGTGPIGSVIGLVVCYYARKLKSPMGVFWGASAPIITIGCTLLIFMLSWSPPKAAFPIPIILSFYTVILFIGVLVYFYHSKIN